MRRAPDEPPVFRFSGRGNLRAFLAIPRRRSKAPREAFSGHMAAGKGSPLYRAHTYHTKVPPQGIEPFIRHYTAPGQVVLDPFCGSGMTGVAALATGRRAILSDLSPAAAFIAHHHCAPIDSDRFLAAVQDVLAAARRRTGQLYSTTCKRCGGDAEIVFTVWSERYRCPGCRRLMSQWHDGLDASLHVRRLIACPTCHGRYTKHSLVKHDHQPVLVHAACPRCGRVEQRPSRKDQALIRSIHSEARLHGLWYPSDPIRADTDEIKRVLRDGVATVDQLFTRRNLLALAALYDEIARAKPRAVRQKLLFTFTASIPRTSRTNKYIPHLHMAPGPIVGTMYLPGFYPELNVWRHFAHKAADIARAMRAAPRTPSLAQALRVRVCSATHLAGIPDRSIDYVFTDPPFGANISYSDVNFVWESWLGRQTARAEEAVVSPAQDKSVDDYRQLMRRSFEELHRVLKPGRWMTLVFHNTAADVWAALLNALADARLEPEAIAMFDKKQGSFKQVTSDGAVDCDVVMHCRRRPARARRTVRRRSASAAEVLTFLRHALANEPTAKSWRQLERRLYSQTIVALLHQGKRLDMDFCSFRQMLKQISSA